MVKLFHQQEMSGPNSRGTYDFACSNPRNTFEVPDTRRVIVQVTVRQPDGSYRVTDDGADWLFMKPLPRLGRQIGFLTAQQSKRLKVVAWN